MLLSVDLLGVATQANQGIESTMPGRRVKPISFLCRSAGNHLECDAEPGNKRSVQSQAARLYCVVTMVLTCCICSETETT